MGFFLRIIKGTAEYRDSGGTHVGNLWKTPVVNSVDSTPE